jgi:predicted RNA-binding Zn-ribbon protein involved in translation (DUF1610 family)
MKDRGLIRAECPTCGEVIAPASELVCGVSEAEETALYEFQCPGCDRVLLIPLAPTEVPTLVLLGARKGRSLPFELLEAHSGPTVSWDEVLDLHFELEHQSFPQDELVPGHAA